MVKPCLHLHQVAEQFVIFSAGCTTEHVPLVSVHATCQIYHGQLPHRADGVGQCQDAVCATQRDGECLDPFFG